jgi:hypothetical protein
LLSGTALSPTLSRQVLEGLEAQLSAEKNQLSRILNEDLKNEERE